MSESLQDYISKYAQNQPMDGSLVQRIIERLRHKIALENNATVAVSSTLNTPKVGNLQVGTATLTVMSAEENGEIDIYFGLDQVTVIFSPELKQLGEKYGITSEVQREQMDSHALDS